jgi:thioester reductase-like protein
MGTIGPHSVTGQINPNDMFAHLRDLSKTFGIPDRCLLRMNWVPVDVLADAIGLIVSSNFDKSKSVFVFHFQSSSPVLGDCFPPESVARCSAKEWRERVGRATADPTHPSNGIRDMLLSMEFGNEGGEVVDMSETRKIVSASFEYTKEMLKNIN